jgi:hypothetical protein
MSEFTIKMWDSLVAHKAIAHTLATSGDSALKVSKE